MSEPRFRVLVTDEVDPEGIAILRSQDGIQVDEVPTLPPAELLEIIGQYDAMVGRSATRISRELLERATRLRVVGRAGVGVDNVDLDRATELGIAVINAPGGNIVSVAELFFAVLLSLLRNVHIAAETMREGQWKRSQLGGQELRGRTIAIVGLGRIGGEVARRARGFAARLVACDPYVSSFVVDDVPVELLDDVERAAADSDIVVVLQHHDAYDFERIVEKAAAVFDTRGRLAGPNVQRL